MVSGFVMQIHMPDCLTYVKGTHPAFVDTRARLGHMLELYEPTPLLTGFYDMVAQAARDWDGRDLVRELG
ncbi:MAG: hypothetical protein KatS3mg120_2675 [Erythrobacter sp.]|nr:MAG: hypothetical protein KatS3mg120_2675 [Erythrobacter sp.]